MQKPPLCIIYHANLHIHIQPSWCTTPALDGESTVQVYPPAKMRNILCIEWRCCSLGEFAPSIVFLPLDAGRKNAPPSTSIDIPSKAPSRKVISLVHCGVASRKRAIWDMSVGRRWCSVALVATAVFRALVIAIVLLPGLLLLAHLAAARLLAVKLGEDHVEDLAIPGDGAALDALLDVLLQRANPSLDHSPVCVE